MRLQELACNNIQHQSRPGSKEARKFDLSLVGVHFSSADPFPVLEEVVSKWKEKKLFAANELSKLDSEKSAKGKVKYLLNVLINQDGNTNEKIIEIFEALTKIGVCFNNLPEVSDSVFIQCYSDPNDRSSTYYTSL